MNSQKSDLMCSKITIITVCFNAKNDLEETIKNVASLGHPNVEYIVIDGGSSDGTLSLLSSYGKVITKWISEPDNGIYDAMNKGWNLAKLNSFIIFLGAGDKLIDIPKIKLDADVIYFGDVVIGSGSVFKSKVDWRLKLGNTVHHQALLIHKSVQISAPFNLKYKTYADYDFSLRLYLQGMKFSFHTNLIGYAKPDGVSSILNCKEMTSIVREKLGFMTWIASYLYLKFQRIRIYLKG